MDLVKKTSDKQIEANRRNAAKSTGPRTPRGKQFSRLNSLRHGLFAESVILLPGEKHEDFVALRRAFRDSYRPKTQTEHFLVDRMILAAWRLARAAGMEARILEAHHNKSESAGAQNLHIMTLIREFVLSPKSTDDGFLRTYPSAAQVADDQAHLEHLEALSQSESFNASSIGRAVIRDSQNGNSVSKLDRRQVTLERSFYRALNELERLRKKR